MTLSHWAHFSDAGADPLHNAGTFVTEYRGEGHGHVACAGDSVGMTDAAGHDAHQRLAASGFLEVNFLKYERGVFVFDDERFDFHGVSLQLNDRRRRTRCLPAPGQCGACCQHQTPKSMLYVRLFAGEGQTRLVFNRDL
ncbi:hypothetical protein N7E01_08565 [Neopusillimonas aromaticivorans]|nr:hypothetical protein [Neopusillimonas aromaticivorans]WJJ94884.1 hypothetical protein N7E01_08565 [Neopusillimonas aromaticivorans]